MGSKLPNKEANQFKLIVKAYETKQYKKGLKAADAILKKFPEHGETLSMKGLILNCMDKKTLAYEFVRKGLKNDLSSHVCWHVYGLLYRSDREYRDAIKCYLNALRIDPQNQQILRDLSLLQVQMRDKAGFAESRRQLLTLKPNNRGNWIAFAIAQHLQGNLEVASQILSAYEGTLEDEIPPTGEKYEHSEMLMYKVSLLKEAGKYQEALDEFAKQSRFIVDKLSIKETRADILRLLQRPAEAEREYESLLAINPDNYNYYDGLLACLGLHRPSNGSEAASLSDRQLSELNSLFSRLQAKHPKSAAAKRIPLDFLSGVDFELALDKYVRPFLRKGVPSLFSDLEPLYDHPGKASIMERVFLRLLFSLQTFEIFPPLEAHEKEKNQASIQSQSTESQSDAAAVPSANGSVAGDGEVVDSLEAKEGSKKEVVEKTREAPTVLLWLLFLLAQHYDRRGQTEKALETIDAAITHTPTVTDLYMVKARVLQKAGDFPAASQLADDARSMDLADRFLNSESVQHMLRADQVEPAEKTAALFTKHGEQHENLFDMQCMWYELASGDSYLRQKNYGRALKNYLSTHSHYNDMVEDQFDFHTYCLRKMTLRAYVAMLRWEDRLHSFPFFCQGAIGAIRCYLALYDSPDRKSQAANAPKLSPEEETKRRQEKARKEEEEKAKALAAAKNAKKGSGPVKPPDLDPDGVKLTQVDDLLAAASKHLNLLRDHDGSALATLEVAFEVHSRKGRLLLCLQDVKALLKLHPDSPTAHKCFSRLFHTVAGLKAADTPAESLVRSVIATEQKELGLDEGDILGSLKKRNEEFMSKNAESLPHRTAAAEVLTLLSPSDAKKAADLIIDSKEPAATGDGAFHHGVGLWSLEDCVSAHRTLLDTFKDTVAATSWKERCALRFPHSNFFEGKKSSNVHPLATVPSPLLDGESEESTIASA